MHTAVQDRSRKLAQRESSGSASHAAFVGASALLFAGSTAATIIWCARMGAMITASGWTTPMLWMRMPGQSWAAAAASFTCAWVVMMIAMMMPSMTPQLRCYRRAVEHIGGTRLDALTMMIAAGYFAVWTLLGASIFALGAAFVTMLANAGAHLSALANLAPIATGAVLIIAGGMQLSTRKAHHLVCCRDVLVCGRTLPVDGSSAWKHGLHYGLHCSECCAPLMAILLALGMMDLRVMFAVTVAITAERLAPNGARVARAIGAMALVAGALLIARASGLT